jgi:fatty acid hydroxylase domain-containing protein 2
MEFITDGIYYYLLFNFIYYATNFILFIVDTTGVLNKHKLQLKEKSEIIETYKKCLPVALKNTLAYSLPTVMTLPFFINLGGYEFTWFKFWYDLIMCYGLTDFIFYCTHRILHTDLLYSKYHKKHHEITAPVGLSATYLTPVDFYSNILSIYLPPILLSSHSFTISAVVILSTLNTILIGHSGYNPIAYFHDDHHKYFNCNYGMGLFADKLFGTEFIAQPNESIIIPANQYKIESKILHDDPDTRL